jgi:predicted flap endonuclease-1-like 5' DNA nuclease
MIWHFLEVWLLLAIAFAAGCALGAYLYGLIADSRLALAQGAVADQVGDIVDRLKASLGMSPAWRPQHARVVERSLPPPAEDDSEEIDDVDDAFDESIEEIGRREEPRFAESRAPVERPRLEAPAQREDEDLEPLTTGDPERLASAAAIGDDGIVPMRPAGLSGPRGGVPDNLTRIRGVGERNETLLNRLGIYHFGQIAAWTPGEVRWIGQYLAFPERIERDDWVGQAMIIATGGDTGFEKSADRRRRKRRERQQGGDMRQLAADVESVMGRRKSQVPPDSDDASDSDDD